MITSRWLPRIGLLPILAILYGCPTREDRLEAVYVANGNIVGKNTASMFDQAIQQGGYQLVNGLADRISVARFKLVTYVAFDVQARDALGGSPQDKIRVIASIGGAAVSVGTAVTLVDGGVHEGPALAVLGDRLLCMWTCGSDVCLSSSASGANWTPPIRKAAPGGRLAGIDLTEHAGHLFVAGVVGPSGSKKLFASQVNVTSTASDFALAGPVSDVVPGDQPDEAEGVSLASDGSKLWLGYVRDNGSRLTSFDGSWSLASSLIEAGTGSRPALAFSRGSLYACYRNGSSLIVRKRPIGSTAWEAGNLTVNDAQANASFGIDCHRITVIGS